MNMMNMTATANDPHPRRRVKVLDTEISYVDVGEGDPIVFLHGNPTGSYLWRNIIACLRARAALAPDPRGHGRIAGIAVRRVPFCGSCAHLDARFETLGLPPW